MTISTFEFSKVCDYEHCIIPSVCSMLYVPCFGASVFFFVSLLTPGPAWPGMSAVQPHEPRNS